MIQRKTIENGEEDPSDFSDVADADVDAFVLSAEEARKKAEMWERMNEDYITRQEEKNKLREAREQAQAQGQPPPGKKPKPRKKSSQEDGSLRKSDDAEAVFGRAPGYFWWRREKTVLQKNQLHRPPGHLRRSKEAEW